MEMLKTHLVTLKLDGRGEINTFQDILDKCIKIQKVIGYEDKAFTKEEFEMLNSLNDKLRG